MSYNLLQPVPIFSAVSMGASATSTVVEIENQDNIGIQLAWTSTPVGTFAVQVSLDYFRDTLGNVVNAGTWTTLTLSSPIAAAGSADNAYIDLNQVSAPYIRVVYTRTSGTGSLTGSLCGKGV